MGKSRHLQIGFSILLSAALLVWVVSSIDLAKTWVYMREARLIIFMPSVILLFLHMYVRAWRWRYLLPGGHRVPIRSLFDSLMIGTLANFIFPMRAGEVVRPYALSRRSHIPFMSGFASLVTERFFDLSVVLFIFVIVTRNLSTVPNWLIDGAWLFAGVAGATLVVMGMCVWAPTLVRRCSKFLVKFLPARMREWEEKLVGQFIESVAILRNKENLFASVTLSILVWGLNFFWLYISLLFLDLPFSFEIATTVGVIIALAVAAPSAPGFVGVYQTACLVGFRLYDVSAEKAVAFSLITHFLQYVAFLSYGVYALWRFGLSMSQLQEVASHEANEIGAQ